MVSSPERMFGKGGPGKTEIEVSIVKRGLASGKRLESYRKKGEGMGKKKDNAERKVSTQYKARCGKIIKPLGKQRVQVRTTSRKTNGERKKQGA